MNNLYLPIFCLIFLSAAEGFDKETCTPGNTQVENYIKLECYLDGRVKGIKPIGCVPDPTKPNQVIQPGEKYEAEFFRYQCTQKSANEMVYEITECLYENKTYTVPSKFEANGRVWECIRRDNSVVLTSLKPAACDSLSSNPKPPGTVWTETLTSYPYPTQALTYTCLETASSMVKVLSSCLTVTGEEIPTSKRTPTLVGENAYICVFNATFQGLAQVSEAELQCVTKAGTLKHNEVMEIDGTTYKCQVKSLVVEACTIDGREFHGEIVVYSDDGSRAFYCDQTSGRKEIKPAGCKNETDGTTVPFGSLFLKDSEPSKVFNCSYRFTGGNKFVRENQAVGCVYEGVIMKDGQIKQFNGVPLKCDSTSDWSVRELDFIEQLEYEANPDAYEFTGEEGAVTGGHKILPTTTTEETGSGGSEQETTIANYNGASGSTTRGPVNHTVTENNNGDSPATTGQHNDVSGATTVNVFPTDGFNDDASPSTTQKEITRIQESTSANNDVTPTTEKHVQPIETSESTTDNVFPTNRFHDDTHSTTTEKEVTRIQESTTTAHNQGTPTTEQHVQPIETSESTTDSVSPTTRFHDDTHSSTTEKEVTHIQESTTTAHNQGTPTTEKHVQPIETSESTTDSVSPTTRFHDDTHSTTTEKEVTHIQESTTTAHSQGTLTTEKHLQQTEASESTTDSVFPTTLFHGDTHSSTTEKEVTHIQESKTTARNQGTPTTEQHVQPIETSEATTDSVSPTTRFHDDTHSTTAEKEVTRIQESTTTAHSQDTPTTEQHVQPIETSESTTDSVFPTTRFHDDTHSSTTEKEVTRIQESTTTAHNQGTPTTEKHLQQTEASESTTDSVFPTTLFHGDTHSSTTEKEVTHIQESKTTARNQGTPTTEQHVQPIETSESTTDSVFPSTRFHDDTHSSTTEKEVSRIQESTTTARNQGTPTTEQHVQPIETSESTTDSVSPTTRFHDDTHSTTAEKEVTRIQESTTTAHSQDTPTTEQHVQPIETSESTTDSVFPTTRFHDDTHSSTTEKEVTRIQESTTTAHNQGTPTTEKHLQPTEASESTTVDVFPTNRFHDDTHSSTTEKEVTRIQESTTTANKEGNPTTEKHVQPTAETSSETTIKVHPTIQFFSSSTQKKASTVQTTLWTTGTHIPVTTEPEIATTIGASTSTPHHSSTVGTVTTTSSHNITNGCIDRIPNCSELAHICLSRKSVDLKKLQQTLSQSGVQQEKIYEILESFNTQLAERSESSEEVSGFFREFLSGSGESNGCGCERRKHCRKCSLFKRFLKRTVAYLCPNTCYSCNTADESPRFLDSLLRLYRHACN